jgi:hypothetical protein
MKELIKQVLREETSDSYYLVMGGKNKKNPPFNVGDKIRQKYTTNDSGSLVPGREEYEFVGMKDDMMLLKTLNKYATNSEDIFSSEAVKMNKKLGYKPQIGQILQLKYIYADRYERIN